jgi:hypothetical protein
MEKFCLVLKKHYLHLAIQELLPYFLDLETQRTMSFLPTIRLNYYIFLSQLYWRSETHEKYTELIKKEGFSNKYFGITKAGKNCKRMKKSLR